LRERYRLSADPRNRLAIYGQSRSIGLPPPGIGYSMLALFAGRLAVGRPWRSVECGLLRHGAASCGILWTCRGLLRTCDDKMGTGAAAGLARAGVGPGANG
jgi:hypothetical protein